ncbi:MAG: hypothetical protein J3K34DRAFT_415906 [Monoraphidium minutum]|nr:MAG: hypothetical protein J3K34DRAFT_415906 [Monoraphidium minutum]
MGDPDEKLMEWRNHIVTRKDFETLRVGTWLNDEIINAYMALLQVRDAQLREAGGGAPRCHFFNTFFLAKLLNLQASDPSKRGVYDYSAVRRWTSPKRLEMAGQASPCVLGDAGVDLVVVPVHQGIHWTCAVVDLKRKELVFLDSLEGGNPMAMAALRRWVADEAKDKLKQVWDTSDWRVITPRVRLQENGCDCGVFASLFANRVALGRGFDFRQADIQLWGRVRVANELLDKTIHDADAGDE